MKYLFSLLGLMLILAFVQPMHATSSRKFIFSNLHYVEESGDQVGTVVCMETSGESLTGILVDIEGAEPISAGILGTKKGSVVLFEGKAAYGTVSFRGNIDDHMLIGTLSRSLGSGTPPHTEALRLNSASAKSKAATFCHAHVTDPANR